MFSLVCSSLSSSPRKNASRISDLREYENDLNFKGINFPIKVRDITKFENYNVDIPGINVFSINDYNKIYPLRYNEKDCQKTIGLFLYPEDEKKTLLSDKKLFKIGEIANHFSYIK